MMLKTTPLLFLALFIGLGTFFTSTSYGFPNLINLQGKLTDSQFNAQHGTHNFTFTVYNALTGGNVRYTETASIPTLQGLWSYQLGSNKTLNLTFDENYYIEIMVDGQVLSPRISMGAVGYAYRTKYSDYVANLSDNAQAAGNLTVGNNLMVVSNLTVNGWTTFNNVTYLWPFSSGLAGQVLTTNGTGGLNWTTLSGGIISGSGSINQLAFWTGVSTLSGAPKLYWDNSSGLLGIGTASPSATVTINGSLNVSGPVIVSSSICSSGQVLSTSSNGTLECVNNPGAMGTSIPASNVTAGTFYGNFAFNGSLTVNKDLILNKTICSGTDVLSTLANGTVVCVSQAVGGNASASGIENYIAKFQGATNLVISSIYENNSKVGVGTTSMNQTLTVAGSANITGTVTVENTKCSSGQVLSTTANGTLVCISAQSVSVAKFVGQTASSYSGNITNGSKSGYDAANYICNNEFSGSHMCATIDIVNTINQNNYTGLTGTGWIVNGPPGYTANANDCKGWTTSASNFLGPFWDWDNTAGGGAGYLTACNGNKKIYCCK